MGKTFAKPATSNEGGASSLLPEITRFGQYVMADHLHAKVDDIDDCDPKSVALVVRDHATGYIGAYPSKDKSADSCIEAMRHFKGNEKIDLIYSDNAHEIVAMARAVGAAPATSTPYRHQSNAVIERAIGVLQQCARVILWQSGLPSRFWSFAVKMAALALNLREGPDGECPWKKRHGVDYPGKLVPFGAKIVFKNYEDPESARTKFSASCRNGILLGVHLNPGDRIRDYIVLDLERFAEQPRGKDYSVYRVPDVIVEDNVLEFPIRDAQSSAEHDEQVRKVQKEGQRDAQTECELVNDERDPPRSASTQNVGVQTAKSS